MNLKNAIMQMKSSAGFSQYQGYVGPLTPMIEEGDKTREKFFITSEPDPHDSFKEQESISNKYSEPVKHLDDPPQKKFLPPISDLKTSTTTSLNSRP